MPPGVCDPLSATISQVTNPAVEPSPRVAVVDLGTNTTRLLVADVVDGYVREIERETVITRLGQGVDADDRLASEAIERVVATVSGFRETIEALGVTEVVAVATSAVRDADNGAELIDRLARETRIRPRTISGSEEARLTFLGATAGRTPRDETLVIDIGGGSTEYVVGIPGGAPRFSVSTALGSVRQTERHLRDDPPSHGETEALAAEARAEIGRACPEPVRTGVEHGVAVAGTATSLAAIAQELDSYDSLRVNGFELTLAEAERITALLAELPLEGRAAVSGLAPARAPTIVAGALILVESMRAFGLEQIEVSEADILYGAALGSARGLEPDAAGSAG